MSLLTKTLLFPNVFNMMLFDNITGETIFLGNMSKNSIKNANEKIDIFAGVDNELIASIPTKRDMTFDGEIVNFDLGYFAYLNGVKPDTTTKKIITFRKEITVTTAAATVTNATKIYGVETLDGITFKIVTGTPATDDEVKIDGTGLTFKTGSTLTGVLVTYEEPQVEGKEAVTINFSSKAFPTSVRAFCYGKVLDAATEEYCADAQIEFYNCSAQGDWEFSMDLGKTATVPMSFKVLKAKTLDGVVNSSGALGRLIVKEL